jgi:hypothetical protein
MAQVEVAYWVTDEDDHSEVVFVKSIGSAIWMTSWWSEVESFAIKVRRAPEFDDHVGRKVTA